MHSPRIDFLCYASIAIAVAIQGIATLYIFGNPYPVIHDEYAYLLGGETFASGHLTNATPEHWESFETFHVLMTPSYMSKYPVGQSLFLAIGFLLGKPILGVFLSVMAMALGLYWMSRSCLSRGVSLAISLLSVLLFGGLHYWSYSYWGGAVACFAGAVFIGSALRLRHQVDLRLSVAYAVSAVILANTRPFEGLVLFLSANLLFLLPLWKSAFKPGREFKSFGVPVLLIGMLGLSAMGIYNKAVTGSYTRMPYLEYHDQYSPSSGLFKGDDHTRDRQYRTEFMQRFFEEWSKPQLDNQDGFLKSAWKRIELLRVKLFGIGLILCTLFGCFCGKRLGLILAFLAIVVGGLATYFSISFNAHYYAPFVPIVFLLAGLFAERIASGKERIWNVSRRMVLGIICVGLLGESLVRGMSLVEVANSTMSYGEYRGRLIEKFQQSGENHLVFVSYGKKASILDEFVYNSAKIETSDVIWARAISPEMDQEVIDYYGENREIWLLIVNEGEPRLVPYPLS